MPRSSTRQPRRPLSRRRLWLFRIGAICVAMLPFVALEAALRVFGYGYNTHLVVPVADSRRDDVCAFNEAADRAYFGRSDLPGPEPRPFRLPKPAGVFRIVVVGGSTVAGFPYPFELSFPRHLEIVLGQQNPDRRIEVLNAGITAINTFSEVDLFRQALACQPDLMILHSGHNEFYGVGGAASTAGSAATPLAPLVRRMRRQRAYQLCASFFQPPLDRNLLEALPADIAIPYEGQIFQHVEAYYRSNLARMAELAAQAGVPLLITTVPANLRDLSPMSSLFGPSLTEQQRQAQARRLATVALRMTEQEFEAAGVILGDAQRVDPSHAVITYRQAQCLEMLERHEEAAAAYVTACDLDGCRFRAPSSFARIARDVAAQSPGAPAFCDVAGELKARSTLPVPGNDFFLEHVHYNIEGHWAVALILGEFIQKEMWHTDWRADRVPDTTLRDELLGLTPLDHLVGDSFALMAHQAWPLRLAPDHPLQVELVTQRMRDRYAALTALERDLFADLSMAAMQQDLVNVMGHSYLRAGDREKALAMFGRHTVRRPWDATGYLNSALILHQQGQRKQAREMLERVREKAIFDRDVARRLEQLENEM